MKKMLKLVSVILVVVMSVCVFASCSEKKDDNVLTMATSADFPPYEFYENDEIVVKLVSPVFCRSVMVDIEDFREPFSDNYFDLLPNEEKIITVKADKEYAVTVKSLSDIPLKGSKLKTNLFRAKFFVEPENLANWFYYTVN